ncbi:thermonuclease family protein [Neptunicoccus cionae]|uniref:thermonuclease family protein n=1 Tax=Neptunicoccus cionae TaxID=2035344 RepID=UPI000C77F57B|nr:thermonuclease family protein [Amylibacter cionae]PLS22361.1 succinoglycan biosynthesis protein [Amylibacter cionae]
MIRVLIALACLSAPVAADTLRIVDGDTLDLGGIRYRINGIDAPEAGQKCKAGSGKDWACGTAATERLFALTRGKTVTCQELATDGYGRIVARCYAGSTDLAREMVAQGMAWAFLKFSDEYEAVQDRAKARRLGIWQAESQTPWDYRAARWEVAAQKAPDGCAIKGNISAKGKIYHAPWSPWYNRTKISLSKGERWFCDEAEAVAAGWRAPYWK